MPTTAKHPSLQPANATKSDFLPLNGTDYVEFYVGNARQSAYFYRAAFGMKLVAYAGPETGLRDCASYVLEQGKVRFVLTTPLRSDNPISNHIAKHGDGIKDIALWVDDATSAWLETTRRGARSVREPGTLEDKHGTVTMASIATYGDTIHTFVERKNFNGIFLPGFHHVTHDPAVRPVGLTYIDHVVGNVGWNEMNSMVDFYRDVMGFEMFQSFDDKDISTEYSALMSKVMSNGNGRVKFPINEPAEGRKKSQIEEYLDFYRTPGVQHLALITDDIIATVSNLQERGVEFLKTSQFYYDHILETVGKIDENLEQLAKLGVLIDHDEDGYLLQIFSKPVVSRPTVFFEVIQRKGARGFGEGNFKALFEALEHEQELRGNL